MPSFYTNAKPLWDAYLSTRAVADRNRLVEFYQPVVTVAVKAFRKRLSSAADFEDLYTVGAMGVIAAVENFDPSRNVTAQTYIATRVRGSILDWLRSIDRLPRLSRERRKRYIASRELFLATHGREPTRDELRAECQVSPHKFAKMEMEMNSPSEFKSLSTRVDYGNGNDGAALADTIVDHKAADPTAAIEQRDFVDYVIRLLPPAHAMFVTFYSSAG